MACLFSNHMRCNCSGGGGGEEDEAASFAKLNQVDHVWCFPRVAGWLDGVRHEEQRFRLIAAVVRRNHILGRCREEEEGGGGGWWRADAVHSLSLFAVAAAFWFNSFPVRRRWRSRRLVRRRREVAPWFLERINKYRLIINLCNLVQLCEIKSIQDTERWIYGH